LIPGEETRQFRLNQTVANTALLEAGLLTGGEGWNAERRHQW
jgi:hypothetical protein